MSGKKKNRTNNDDLIKPEIWDIEIPKKEQEKDSLERISDASYRLVYVAHTLGNKHMDNNRREIEANKEIELESLKNERIKIKGEQRQQLFSNFLIVGSAVTFITLGVQGLLNIEYAVFLMAIMFIGPIGLNSLKGYLNQK